MLGIEELKASLDQPFPGLRAFEPSQSFLFFGREIHTRELLRRLTSHRLLAIVGSSGSGKSSVVRAGLVAALQSGHLSSAGSGWKIAIMKPGSAPLDELSEALQIAYAVPPGETAGMRRTLGLTSLGLLNAVRGLRAGSENLLLVVDQFEELFRFRRERQHEDQGAEASLFVASLLEATEQFEVPIYVVLTMRSDFLGDCTQFPGLPEALNRSQYLIPRLQREQCREAIEGPERVAGATISARLVQRLLNDAAEDGDQLPILQHALAATFADWKREGGKGEIDLPHYEASGGLKDALNRHAEGLYRTMSETDQKLTERIFRCLTTTEGGRAVRRPARLSRIFEVVDAGEERGKEQVRAVIRRFAGSGNSLLISSDPALPDDAVIDISHESLIRKWETLKRWVRLEADSAEWYRSLVAAAKKHQAGDAGLWRDPELERVLEIKRTQGWNEAWASQYVPNYGEVVEFLSESSRAQRRRRTWIGAGVAIVIVAALFGYSKYRVDIAKQQAQIFQIRDEVSRAVERADDERRSVEKLRRDLDQARDPKDRLKLMQELSQREKDLATVREEANAKQKELATTKQRVADAEPLVRAAADQIDKLQKELVKVRKERDDAMSQLYTNRKQASSPGGSRKVQPTMLQSCFLPVLLPLEEKSVLLIKVGSESLYVYNGGIDRGDPKASVVDLYLLFTDNPWWKENEGPDQLDISRRLKKSGAIVEPGTYTNSRLRTGATLETRTQSGWRIRIAIATTPATLNEAVISACGERLESSKD